MRKLSWIYVYLFSFFSISLFADDKDPLKHLESYSQTVELTDGLPSNIVNGSVSVISGEYVDHCNDIFLPGPRPLTYNRTYSNYIVEGSLYDGWNDNHCSCAFTYNGYYNEKKAHGVMLRLPHGSKYSYVKEKKKQNGKYDLIIPKGLTNGSTGLSGGSNIKNTRVRHDSERKLVIVKGGDGSRKVYSKVKEHQKITKYQLESDTNAKNQSIIYDREPYKITAKNNQTGLVYSFIKFKTPSDFSRSLKIHLLTSDDRKITYGFKRHTQKRTYDELIATPNGLQVGKVTEKKECFYLAEANKNYAPIEKYEYSKRQSDNLLQISQKNFPDSRFLSTKYYREGSNDLSGPLGTLKLDKTDMRIDRVRQQMAPVGEDSTAIPIYRFDYHMETKITNGKRELEKGSTDVYDAYWHKKVYSYNKDQRLKKIITCKGVPETGYATYSTERFLWGKKNTQDEANLITKYLKEGGILHHGCHFSYDSRGNTLTKTLFGKITGRTNPDFQFNQYQVVETGYERETLRYSYSDDGLNLLLSENNSDSKTIFYEYFPKTDLLLSKKVQYDGRVQSREFYHYDEDKNLLKKIADNGQGAEEDDFSAVTVRLISYYFPQKKIPYGLHERIDEKYYDFDKKEEVLIGRTENQFSKQGQLLSKKTFDSHNQLAFTESWEYDAHGNVTKEVKPNGGVILREYDQNRNLIVQKGPHPDYTQKNTYDYSNRLIKKEEFHSDGVYFSESHRYNYLNQEVATCDYFGNQTNLHYNDVGHLTIKEFPYVQTSTGECVRPTIHMQYDVGGALTFQQDGLGNKTHYQNNLRGKPLLITHPDGTQEKMYYRLDGELVEKIAIDGTRTVYHLDPVGHCTNEKQFDADNNIVKQIYRTYNTHFLVKEESSDGITIEYIYDYAGRLSKTYKNNLLIQQTFYDALGRIHRVHDYYNTENYRVTIKSYDVLNRLIGERLETPSGQLLHIQAFAYDTYDNKTMVQVGDQITHTTYNSYNRPTKIVDSLGNETHILYNFHAVDQAGQRILEVTTTDALGNQTIQRYDALNRLIQQSRKNAFNRLLSNQILHYDLCGNCVQVIDECIYNEKVEKSISTISRYDCCNRLIQLIEAEGTPDQKITVYEYNSLGQKISKIKPDDSRLHYTYDKSGRLKENYSTDQTVAYEYEYDERGFLVYITDKIQNTSNHRVYNHLGQMTEERLDNGLVVRYQYDLFDRVTNMTLPDQSQIVYRYDPINLKEVIRLVNDQATYCQISEEHNLAGLIKKEIRPGKIGIQTYDYDALGRTIRIHTDQFNQEVPSDGFDPVGNLRKYKTNQDESLFDYDDLYQIIAEKGSITHEYGYDSLSNRRIKDEVEQTANYLNQIQTNEEAAFDYDTNGNLIEVRSSDRTSHYTYDALDRLIASEENGVHTSYTYDSFSRRISKKHANAEPIYYFYQNVEEIGSWQGKIKELKVLNDNTRKSVAIEIDGVPYVPIQDLFGHVVRLFDMEGNLDQSYSYSVFGEMLGETNKNPWQYSNRRYDQETGLLVFNLRYYDPRLGRWISADPAGYVDGPNLYAHVHNNPLKYYDLLGLVADDVDFSIKQTLISTARATSDFAKTTFSLAKSLITNPDSSDLSGLYSINSFKNPDTGENYNYPSTQNRVIIYRNGIYTDFAGFSANLKHLADLSNNEVLGAFEATNGLLPDALQYHSRRRRCRRCCSSAKADFSRIIRHVAEKSPEAQMLIVAHSRGCVDTRNALEKLSLDICQRISALAVAPGGYIERSYCKEVEHLSSDCDFVPKIDRYGRMKCRNTTVVLHRHPQASRIFDHSFNSPTYESHINIRTRKFIETGCL